MESKPSKSKYWIWALRLRLTLEETIFVGTSTVSIFSSATAGIDIACANDDDDGFVASS